MSKPATISTREAAERLHVHARTIRKWIDVFAEYIRPEWNDRGHYVLTEESFNRLADIQERLQQQPNKSMRQVRLELYKEGKLKPEQPPASTQDEKKDKVAPFLIAEKALQHMMKHMENIGEMVSELYERLERMEEHTYSLFDAIEELDNKFTTMTYEYAPANDVHLMFDEIRKKQDQLRIELRNLSFNNRLAAASEESQFVPRRQKKSARFLGIF
jgi:DNA-binding transcriptional MerR regulator